MDGNEDISDEEDFTYNKGNVFLQVDGNEDISFSEDIILNETNLFLQVDGNDDLSEFEDDIPIPSNLYTINYEDQKICTWINFFRGFDFIWKTVNNHSMCNLRKLEKGFKNCFYCVMRSACLRLSNRGNRGPKSLKPYEVISQIGQLNVAELDNVSVVKLIENSISLLTQFEPEIVRKMGSFKISCEGCKEIDMCSEEGVTKINTENYSSDQFYSIEQIISSSSKRNEHKSCQNKNLVFHSDENVVIFSFSKPVNLTVQKISKLWGNEFVYKSHIKKNEIEKTAHAYFEYNSYIYTQEKPAKMKSMKLGMERDVHIIAFYVRESSNTIKTLNELKISEFTYKIPALDFFRQISTSIINPEKHKDDLLKRKLYEEKRSKDADRITYKEGIEEKRRKTDARIQYNKEYEEKRSKEADRNKYKDGIEEKRRKTDARIQYNKEYEEQRSKDANRNKYKRGIEEKRRKTPARTQYSKEYDVKRRKTDARIQYNKEYEKKRSKDPKRIKSKQKIETKRRRTEQRKSYLRNYEYTEQRQQYNKDKYQKKLISTYSTDTGFGVICSCCLQYKNKMSCKDISVLSAKQQHMYVIKRGYVLENREKNKFYICNSCKTYIDREEMPKKCLKENFSFANFPSDLIQKLKKKCQIKDDNLSSHFKEGFMRQ